MITAFALVPGSNVILTDPIFQGMTDLIDGPATHLYGGLLRKVHRGREESRRCQERPRPSKE